VTGEALKQTRWSRLRSLLLPQCFSAERIERYGKIRNDRWHQVASAHAAIQSAVRLSQKTT
jgi:hypothetical protein